MRRGYTLVELVVALAILAVMAAAAVPALGVWLDQEPLPEEAVAELLRSARSAALEAARPATVTVNPVTGRWLLELDGRQMVEGRLDVAGAALGEPGPDGRVARLVIRFASTGGADGGAIPVRTDGRTTVVRADRWTGEVSLDDG